MHMILIMSPELTALFNQAEPRRLSTNDLLFRNGDSIASLHLVDDGCIALERHLENGALTCLQRAVSGQVLAEASLYADNYHCDARALEPTRFRSVPKTIFKKTLRSDAKLAENWAMYLSQTVQRSRFLSELRSVRTVSDRLDMWLGEFGSLPEKGQWVSVAAELAVSPEAMYRELARREQKS